MKHQTNKLLLTTALLAALGSNYSLQANSLEIAQQQSISMIEYASVASDAATPQALQPNASNASVSNKPSTTASSTASASPTATASAPVNVIPESYSDKPHRTEAAVSNTSACPNNECSEAPDQAPITAAQLNELVQKVEALEKLIAESKARISADQAKNQSQDTKTARVSSKYEDCIQVEEGETETREQKKERLACEKEAKDNEKLEKLASRLDDKIERMQKKCDSDVECLATEFNSALRGFSGSNKLPDEMVRQQFKIVVGSELSKSLYGMDAESAASALSKILASVPAQYKGVKQTALDLVKTQATQKAASVTQLYAQANTVSKTNNPQAYLQIMNQAQQEHSELTRTTEAYSAIARNYITSTGDSDFAKYYQSSYLPSLQRVFNSIIVSEASNTANNNSNTTNTANTRTSDARVSNNVASTTTNNAWDSSINSGVQFGAPTFQPTQQRGSRPMGQ
ncbi:MAG: hypothetical protein ACK41T_10285 [Pseudobdellovibrio sp.]